MKRRALALFLCCALTVTAFTGCSGGGDEGESGTKSEEITIAYDYKTPIDPFTYPSDLTRSVVDSLIRATLTENDGEQITPVLAESYETSKDGLNWTFHLRDAKFSDGKELTADDVVGSLEYALSTPMGASNYMGYSAKAIDEKTVVISVERYSANTAHYIGELPIINAESFESMGEDEYFNKLIGTGPYILDSYEEATGLAELSANPDYWGEEPSIKKVTMRYIPDSNTALIALRKGEVDFAPIPSSTYEQASDDGNLKTVFGLPTMGNFIIFNTQAEPFDDPLVRQAVLYAIDFEGIAKMSGIEGNYNVPNCFFMEEWGMDKPDDFTEYNYDPEKAKELLEEAGVQTPLNLGEIQITQAQQSIWEAVQQNLADAGITITVGSVEDTVWLDNIWKGNFIMAAINDMDMVSTGYTGVCDVFHSEGIELGYNYCRYSDPDLDEYIDEARKATKYEDQNRYFSEVLKIVNNEALWGIIYNYGRIFAMNKDLSVSEDNINNTKIYFNEMSWN